MVWLDDKSFVSEHEHLIKVLKSGTDAERAAEAKDQSKELKEHNSMKHNIHSIHVEPADNGFLVEVTKKASNPKKGDNMIMSHDELTSKHVCADAAGVGELIESLFPAAKSRTKKGKENTSESGSSRVDTYEAESGDEED